MDEQKIVASAPAKVILAGGKAVNYGSPAIGIAVSPRTYCTLLFMTKKDQYIFEFKDKKEYGDREQLISFKKEIDRLYREKNYTEISRIKKKDFFAPVRYVFSFVHEQTGSMGYHLTWDSEIPDGSGLGSGAAASASMALATCKAAGLNPSPQDIAWLAWQGDVIAHGGLGTGLDSGICALGGAVRYSLKEGPSRINAGSVPHLVIGDTLLRASTAETNVNVQNWLEEHPAKIHLMTEMGILVDLSNDALIKGDMVALGHFMNLCHLIKEKIGMSLPKTECMIEAALQAGALGAKISGKGQGGIIIALSPPGNEKKISAAIDSAGGKGIIPDVGIEGARIEQS